MKFSMLALSIVFIACLVGVVFAGNAALTKCAFESKQDKTGRVLGVSEKIKIAGLPMAKVANEENGRLLNLENNASIPKKIRPEQNMEISAASGIVIDCASGEVLFAKETDKKMPIASLTKLLTALVFLDHNPGWETIYQIKKEDKREGGRIYLYAGEKVFVKDLFCLSLAASANTATIAMVYSTGLSESEFVEKMNGKARELGLAATRFNDPVGLSGYNVSNAAETAKIIAVTIQNQEILKALSTKKCEFYTLGNKRKTAYNTDKLLDSDMKNNNVDIIGGKTGYTEAAGYCFAGKFKNDNEYELITVVLGDISHSARFEQTKKLLEWIYGNYIWPAG